MKILTTSMKCIYFSFLFHHITFVLNIYRLFTRPTCEENVQMYNTISRIFLLKVYISRKMLVEICVATDLRLDEQMMQTFIIVKILSTFNWKQQGNWRNKNIYV